MVAELYFHSFFIWALCRGEGSTSRQNLLTTEEGIASSCPVCAWVDLREGLDASEKRIESVDTAGNRTHYSFVVQPIANSEYVCHVCAVVSSNRKCDHDSLLGMIL
jgi:hypothetical protein